MSKPLDKIDLCVKDVKVVYRNGHCAISNASFTLNGNTICALVGMNGGGKSTLFKTIMGIVKPTSGYVKINNESVDLALKNNLIAYVPQSEEVDWNFPVLVKDVVMMGRYGKMNFLRIPKKSDYIAVEKALERLNLTKLANRQIGELSGGQKQRTFLARACVQEAPIWLLDEPFTGIDVKTEDTMINLFKELKNQGHLILVSTHNLGSVSEFCDKVVLINRKVLAAGPVETTFTQKNLEATFGGSLRHLHLSHNKEKVEQKEVTLVMDDEKPAVFYNDHCNK